MKRNKDKGEAGDDESKLHLSTLARKCTEKKFHCGKFMEALIQRVDYWFQLNAAYWNLMHQCKCQEEKENISKEQISLFSSSFLTSSPLLPCHSFVSMDLSLVIVIHEMITDLVLDRLKLNKDFLAWRTFPITFLDAFFRSHLSKETFTRMGLLDFLWYTIQLDENFSNIAWKVFRVNIKSLV